MTDNAQNEQDRRQSFRIDMEEELIDISWQDSQGNLQQQKIVCLNFSRGGLKIVSDREISANTEVTVVFKAADPNSQKLATKVLRCIANDNQGFNIALQIL
jgi:c-di-GMP-binding flagellar brake protein YcgR